ncbi:double-strand break repair protein AddB [Kordiimonas lipolytica]|uniref:Double-strand break repair protein AddB n=1 Tax=Kordiimonas lipolytica TaxID=1662421 RepID=A0ABV8UD34_9PROT|nr:double-strand break repair protein AddB [Kordiimonas lipolytica]
MADRDPTIFTVDPAYPFVDALAAGLISRAGGDPTALADMTVLVPNRRAGRSLREAFLRQLGQKPTLLPAMRPIGDVDEDEITFLGAGLGLDPSDLKPAIGGTRRQVLLMQQVMRWIALKGERLAPAQGWRLAGELAKLMDSIDTEGLSFDGLKDLVPENLAHHWEDTLAFLKIVSEHWPAILEAEGAMNPAARRDAMLDIVAEAWAQRPPVGQVFAAGSTGSIPATAKLLSVVARMPNGAVILPGLDRDMPDRAWDAIDATHPQGVLKSLLLTMGANRHEVAHWPVPSLPVGPNRGLLLRHALLPAKETDGWRGLGLADADDPFAGLKKLVAPTRREEADAIAVMMREVLEEPSKTAALVTPDRALARMVRASLSRWGIEVDDSGGDRVLNTLPGRFMGLLASAASEQFSPVALLSLLQHPFVAVGLDRPAFLASLRRLDTFVLRGVRPAGGLHGLMARARVVAQDTKAGFNDDDIAVLECVIKALAPLEQGLAEELPLDALLRRHVGVAEALASTEAEAGEAILWKGEEGQALADALADLIQETTPVTGVMADGYAALFDELLAGVSVRPVWRQHPRLSIWGTLEARLQRADLMILGGLNEGTWPGEVKPEPWMNRPMRAEFGLPPLERRIGQSAHDFVQAASGGDVVLTRAEKVGGAPTVPSRWLFRIEALAGREVPSAGPYLDWAAALDRSAVVTPCLPPRPTPPLDARPSKLSVTQVETWMRDPYGLYAQKVLGFRPLDPVDDRPNAATKGTLLHEALERFLLEDGPTRGDAGLKRLMEVGRKVFEDVLTMPTVYAFWWPRFERIADWFVKNEAERAELYDVAAVESWAEAKLPGADFTLIAKADRIDRRREGGALTIIDYKTGNIPTKRRMEAGFAPQLPLEGWLAERGAFEGVDGTEVEDLVFWELKGGEPVQKQHRPIKDVPDIISDAEQGLTGLVKEFSKPTTPYLSNPRPKEAGYGDYDHLARVKEWRNADDPFGGGKDG